MWFSEVAQINRNLFRHPVNRGLITFEVACSTSQLAKGGFGTIAAMRSEISVALWVSLSFEWEKVRCVVNLSSWLHWNKKQYENLNELWMQYSYEKKTIFIMLLAFISLTLSRNQKGCSSEICDLFINIGTIRIILRQMGGFSGTESF